MDIFYISDTQVILNPMTATPGVDVIGDGENDVSDDAYRFMWIDVTHDEVETWRTVPDGSNSCLDGRNDLTEFQA